jgi:hypothetical protein
VLHDSQGFEPSEIANLEKVKNFIKSRGPEVDLKDRVHAIWWISYASLFMTTVETVNTGSAFKSLLPAAGCLKPAMRSSLNLLHKVRATASLELGFANEVDSLQCL